MVNILFEDEYIVICEKMPGMLSEESDCDESLANILKKQLNCEIFPLHRLDKPVGGAIMYAKTKKSAAAFSKIISENRLNKTYLAVLDGTLTQKEGRMRDLLFKDSRKNKAFVVKRERKGVKEAVLDYRIIAENDRHSLAQIVLETGRSHQIRVQFASRKVPLCGDGKYGSRDNRCNVSLHSHSLEFVHPFTGVNISIISEPDMTAYPWSEFRTKNGI